MSWSNSFKANSKAELATNMRDASMPDAVKEVVSAVVASVPGDTAVTVSTSGHFSQDGGPSSINISVSAAAAEKPAEAPVEEAVAEEEDESDEEEDTKDVG
jgi:hypothetical protein